MCDSLNRIAGWLIFLGRPYVLFYFCNIKTFKTVQSLEQNKIQTTMKQRILFLTLAILMAMTTLHANDYNYIVIQQRDGSTAMYNTGEVAFTFDLTAMTLTVNTTVYQMSDLKYMYFTNSTTADNVITVPAIGWATACSTQPLDFTNIDGLTAYTGEVGTSMVALTEITAAVPAKTGVVIKADEGTYHIPVAESANAVSQDLLGTTTDLTTTADNAYYALAKYDDATVGFMMVNTGVTIPAGKAYFTVSPSAARSFYYMEEHTATTIESMTVAGADTQGDYYDLQGRKVSQPTKGIYLKNGKKIIIK